jgi:hypothetical protein
MISGTSPMRLEKTEREHHDQSQDIEACLKLAGSLKRRLSKIGESLNVVGGNLIDDAQISIICAAHARTVEALLQNIVKARHISSNRLLS